MPGKIRYPQAGNQKAMELKHGLRLLLNYNTLFGNYYNDS